jgi:hypothetical protein
MTLAFGRSNGGLFMVPIMPWHIGPPFAVRAPSHSLHFLTNCLVNFYGESGLKISLLQQRVDIIMQML